MIERSSEQHFVPVGNEREIHLRHFPADGPVLLLLHGAIENGRIFYSRSGRGLAPWLAEQGFDVWVMDLGGRGDSRPAIAEGIPYSQTESITREIPAVMDYLESRRPGAELHWLAHSWGGVMMTAVLARYPDRAARIRSMVFFGSKRRVRVWNWRRILYVDVIWCWLSPLITRLVGYLPASRLRFGSDDESRLTHAQGTLWVRKTNWIDPEDGFDYRAALAKQSLPPTLYLAGRGDHALGHPDDVQRLMEESGQGEQQLLLLSRETGHHRDYGHIDMLTAPEAVEDHFPAVVDWFRRFSDSSKD